MATKNAGYRKLTGAEQRALAQQLAPTAAPSEATVREGSFLRNVTGAGDDLEWILLNQAWTQLGFERVGDWWEQRVLPVLEKLDLRPSVSLAERVIAAIQADEQVLPKVQRRTQREIASIAKTSQSKVSRSLPNARESGSDLEEASAAGPVDPPESAAEVDASEGASADGVPLSASAVPRGTPAGTSEVLSSPLAGPGNPQDTPAAGTALPGEDTSFPLVSEPRQPGQDSPPVLGSEGFPGRAETDHQQVAGVSPAGVAPAVASTAAVEPVELEDDGTAPRSSSSSDLDVPGNPAERLLFAVAGLVHYLDQLDVDAVGPLLDGPDVEQLFEHAEAISAHIERIGKARFAAMLHP